MGMALKIVGVMCLLTAFGNFVSGRADNIPLALMCLVFGAVTLFRGITRD
jgi:hypothetical protein